MPCTPSCGACCDPVTLGVATVDRAFAFGPASPQMEWIWNNLMPLKHRGDDGVLLMCVNYDIESRACLAYDTRPPVCRDYPFYGKEADPALDPGGRIACGYQAEAGRTVLPLVEVR